MVVWGGWFESRETAGGGGLTEERCSLTESRRACEIVGGKYSLLCIAGVLCGSEDCVAA